MITERKGAPPSPFGFALFPDDTVTQGIKTSLSAEELKRVTQQMPSVVPYIIGAIEYRSAFSATPHHTGFIIEVRRSDRPRAESVAKNRWPQAIFIDEGNVPADDVRLFRSFIEGGYAD